MSDHPPPPRRPVNGVAITLGIVLALPLGIVPFLGAPGWAIAAVVVVGALVLVARDQPFQRGLGSGLLIGSATAVLLVGSCFALASQLDLLPAGVP